MPDWLADKRMSEFRARPLPWLVVHHFLDAELVRELLSAIVTKSSGGRLSLGDLFDETLATGDPATASWFLATRETPDAFASFLSRLILAVVWRGDDFRFVEPDGLEAKEAEWAKSLVAALSLGVSDFGSDPILPNSDETKSLSPLATAMREARQAVRGNASNRWLQVIEEATIDAPPLLSALFTKHIGDLFGDTDCWDLALKCYLQASERLGVDQLVTDSLWTSAVVRTKQIIAQSVAMATWHLDGPEQAAAHLEVLVFRSTVAESPLPLLNASFDLLNAHHARGSFSTAWSDRRPATYAAPLLLQSYRLDNALTYAATGRFTDCHRWFWASLRRQMALGGTTATWQTKGHYGRAVIDEIEASLDRERQPDAFAMGVRLLVESGQTELANATSWSERLVEAYVTPKTLADLRAAAARNPGTIVERELVATTLRRQWLLAIPRDRVELAREMLADLATSAHRGEHTGISNTNTGGLALKALKNVATERPEFRRLLGFELVALFNDLRQRSGVLEFAETMETAAQFIDGVGVDAAEALCWRAVEMVEELPADAAWPVTRAASQFLGSDAASAFSRRDNAFLRRRSVALVKLALSSAAEHASLLYLLRDVDPSVVREHIDADGLEAVVDGIRERARNTSSSAATTNIHALLVAPKIAGKIGIGEALDGINLILRSAASPRPSPSLQNGYEVLLLIARNGDKIAEDLGPAFDFRARARHLLAALQDMWRSVASRPLIFAGFAIPPRSAPDRVTVHNWTFATIEFVRWLGASAEFHDTLAAIAANELLAEGMSTALSVQATALDTLDMDVVAKERAEAFYAALGERLVAMGSHDLPGAAAWLRVLLDRCLQLGPRGEDAALLLASRGLGITLDPTAEAVNTYITKLRRDVKLRLSLSPLLKSVLDETNERS